MVQPEIQTAQDAALCPQKLGSGKGASSQEAEGGGLRMREKEVGEPWIPHRYSLSWSAWDGFSHRSESHFLLCKMGPLICCMEVMESIGFRVRQTWLGSSSNPTNYSLYDMGIR